MSLHENMTHITGAGHQLHKYEFANSAGRLAGAGYTFTADSVKKVALQLDDMSTWLLINHSPITWVPVGKGSAAISASTITNTPAGGIEAINVQDAIDELDMDKEPANANIQSHISATDNPHTVTATQVGLGNVDNTSDANKPVSTATSTALGFKAPLESPTFTGTVSGITKGMVGLGNVTNDAQIPIGQKGFALGVAELDNGGKVPVAQLPAGMLVFKGEWNAATNSPTLANGTGTAGDVWECKAAGTVNFGAGNFTFAIGDWVVYNGTIWELSINSNIVASVFGRTGAVGSSNGDYTASQVTNVPAGNIAAVTVQAALNELDSDKAATGHNHSGTYEPVITTLAIAKGGTGLGVVGVAKNFFASPVGSSGAPTWRVIATQDLPTYIDANTSGYSASCTGNSATATTATTAYKIRTAAPGSPSDGDIWMV